MQVQKKDKDGKPMVDASGNPLMEEGPANLDPTELAKQVDEMKAKQAEMERTSIAQIERANRAEALLQSYVQGNGGSPAPQAPAYNPYGGSGIDPSKLITEPDKVLDAVRKSAVDEAVKVMEKRYREAEGMKAQMETIRNSFYKDNPDLTGFEKIVGFAEEEMRLQYPNTQYIQLLPIIATKARAEVVALKNKFAGPGGQPPVLLENGGRQVLPPPPAPEGPKKTEGEQFSDYMEERKAMLSKTRT